jgi:hypothetical protein
MGFLLIQSHQNLVHQVPYPINSRLGAARYSLNVLDGTKFKVLAIFFLFNEQSFGKWCDIDHIAEK